LRCGANWTIGSQPLKEDSNALPDAFSTDQTVRIYTLPVTVIGSNEISGFRLDKIKELLL